MSSDSTVTDKRRSSIWLRATSLSRQPASRQGALVTPGQEPLQHPREEIPAERIKEQRTPEHGSRAAPVSAAISRRRALEQQRRAEHAPSARPERRNGAAMPILDRLQSGE